MTPINPFRTIRPASACTLGRLCGRLAAIASVAATADALRTALAQMQFLEDARNIIQQLKNPDDVA